MVEVGTAKVEALPAKEFNTWSVAGNRERKRLAGGVFAQAVAGHRIYGDLVRDRPESRQDFAASYHDSRVILVHHRQCDLVTQHVVGAE